MNPKMWFYSEKPIIATLFKQITAFQELKNLTDVRWHKSVFIHTVCGQSSKFHVLCKRAIVYKIHFNNTLPRTKILQVVPDTEFFLQTL